ncbi:TonB-dependent receptor [Solimonas terrae]|uniref:TonB-dependent receptor n=1 Tax=Solimonas terrae TaxID=1396819 RepID=A0A6M2BTZ7_9GAMM|nr:TonB-dependent receptor [Solimonas terrae]NGY05854.1 TonB-dependent receptor [Solimonas terrae]
MRIRFLRISDPNLRRAALLGLGLIGLPSTTWAQSDAAAATSTPDAQKPAEPADELQTVPTISVPDTPPPPVASSSSSSSDGAPIAEIVVTATKREERVRRIPASITAVSGEMLENAGKQSLNDFIQQSPGVTASQSNSGYTRISIRGISTDTKPITETSSPVGILIGDTAFTDPYISSIVPDLSAFDLAGVQILKGPQGTLFGAAALSGAIRYELQEPVIGEWQARMFSQYVLPSAGSGAFTEGLAVNAPVLDTAALRLDYIHRRYPGAYDDVRSDPVRHDIDTGRGQQLRAIALWEPAPRWKFKLTHINQNYASPDASGVADARHGPRATDQEIVPSPVDNRFDLDSLEANYDFDTMRVVSLTSHTGKHANSSLDLTYSAVGSPPPPGYPAAAAFILASSSKTHSISQELRLQSTGDGPFQWLFGAYYYDYGFKGNIILDSVAQQNLTGPGSLLGQLLDALDAPLNLEQRTSLSYGDYDIQSHEYALFTDLGYQLLDDLKLSAGARFYRTTIGGISNGDGLLVIAANGGMPTRVDVSDGENGVNPKLSLTYDISRDMMLYATVVKGFRFGGINTTPSTVQVKVPPTYKSDTLWNYEAGLRTNWLDDSLHADLAAFYIQYKNPIIKQQQGTTIYTDNVGGAISRGLEASLLWNTPLDGLTLSASAGLTDAHTTRPFTDANGKTVAPGTQMPGAARSQYSTSLQYMRPLGMLMTATSVGYTYVGKGFDDLTHDIPINDYGTLDAGFAVSTLLYGAKARLSFNVANILDETTPISGATGTAILNPLATATAYYLNPPRTYTVRLSVDY